MNLDRLIGRLDALASGSFADRVKRRVAVGGLQLTAQCFQRSTDPYGVAWPTLKRPRPGGPVEVKTGAMRDSALANPTPDGVRYSVNTPYAGFQHWGTATNPQRRLLPVGFLGLPPSWVAMIRSSFDAELRGAMRA